MKSNVELRAALNMVLTRLEADPKSVDEWEAIAAALKASARYAEKVKAMRAALSEKS